MEIGSFLSIAVTTNSVHLRTICIEIHTTTIIKEAKIVCAIQEIAIKIVIVQKYSIKNQIPTRI